MRYFFSLFILLIVVFALLPFWVTVFRTPQKEVAQPIPTLPAFAEGGTLVLSLQNRKVPVKLDEAKIWCRKIPLDPPSSGLVLRGPGTYIDTHIPLNLFNADNVLYQAVIGKRIQFSFPFPPSAVASEAAAPNQPWPCVSLGNAGKFSVIAGNFTLQSHELGRDQRVRWKGDATVVIQTSEGPVTLNGTFVFGATNCGDIRDVVRS